MPYYPPPVTSLSLFLQAIQEELAKVMPPLAQCRATASQLESLVGTPGKSRTVLMFITMVMSWHRNAFRIGGPLWGESPWDSPHIGPVMRSFWEALMLTWRHHNNRVIFQWLGARLGYPCINNTCRYHSFALSCWFILLKSVAQYKIAVSSVPQ